MTMIRLLKTAVDTYFACWPRAKPTEAQLNTCRLIAHRGVHDKQAGLIENTHAAFERALALGCWGIELDVQLTLDGVLVVNHDANLARIWNIDVAIAELTFTKLRQLVPLLPSLDEVVSRFGKRLHLFIELKAPLMQEAALVTSLQSLTPIVDYHLLSLDETIFTSLTKLPQAAKLLVALHDNVGQFCQLSLQKNYGGVLGHYLLLTNKRIASLHLANQHIGTGFVNSKYTLYRELNRGIQWIFSDKIEQLQTALTLHLPPRQ